MSNRLIKHDGDLLSVTRGIIVHGCNCRGVMGSGVAAQIRTRWPDVYRAYKFHESAVGLRLGDVNFVAHTSKDKLTVRQHVHTLSEQLPTDVVVANAMTQQDFGREPARVYVSYDAISATFSRIALVARALRLPVHFPLIGCGLAGGSWDEVSWRIVQACPDVELHLWVPEASRP